MRYRFVEINDDHDDVDDNEDHDEDEDDSVVGRLAMEEQCIVRWQ